MNFKLKAGMLFLKSSEKKCVKSLPVLKVLKLDCNPLPGVCVYHLINNYAILLWFFLPLYVHIHTVLLGLLDWVATVCG